jgi:hypothetical protein
MRDLLGEVVDGQHRHCDAQVALPLGQAARLHFLGGTGVLIRAGPLGAQVELRASPAALAGGAPTNDPRTDLVRWRARVRAVLEHVGHPAFMIQGGAVARIVNPAHRRTLLAYQA